MQVKFSCSKIECIIVYTIQNELCEVHITWDAVSCEVCDL